jgi:hypothetical protein
MFFGQHGGLNQNIQRKSAIFEYSFIITFLKKSSQRNSNDYKPYIFDHARLRYATDDMVRGRQTSVVPFPVCIAAVLRSQCQPTSGHVGSGTSESGVVGNVGVAAEIASLSPSV